MKKSFRKTDYEIKKQKARIDKDRTEHGLPPAYHDYEKERDSSTDADGGVQTMTTGFWGKGEY